jgi:hypothetical protein
MRPATLIAIAAIAVAAAGCSSGPPPVTSHGTLTLYADPLGGTPVAQGYPDITDGAQISVTDSSGKVIGTGTFTYDKAQTKIQAAVEAAMLGRGVDATLLLPDIAVYHFTASGLPGGLPRYGLKIGNRAVHWESAKAIKDPELTLGSP